MKIGIVDSKLYEPKWAMILRGFHFRRLKEAGLEITAAGDFDDLESLGKKIEEYDGALVHTGIDHQREAIERMSKLPIEFPWAIVTISDISEYAQQKEIPVLSYLKPDKILEFFQERLRVKD